MESSQAAALKKLLESQQVASLGTLHKDVPAVSMVPFALLPQGQGLVIHVSQLATHTKDMLANPAVSVLVIAPPGTTPPHELPRVSIQGSAEQCLSHAPAHSEAKQAYLSRFPQSEEMFAFADFSLFVISVRSVRFVGGFAQATSMNAENYAAIMSASS